MDLAFGSVLSYMPLYCSMDTMHNILQVRKGLTQIQRFLELRGLHAEELSWRCKQELTLLDSDSKPCALRGGVLQFCIQCLLCQVDLPDYCLSCRTDDLSSFWLTCMKVRHYISMTNNAECNNAFYYISTATVINSGLTCKLHKSWAKVWKSPSSVALLISVKGHLVCSASSFRHIQIFKIILNTDPLLLAEDLLLIIIESTDNLAIKSS